MLTIIVIQRTINETDLFLCRLQNILRENAYSIFVQSPLPTRSWRKTFLWKYFVISFWPNIICWPLTLPKEYIIDGPRDKWKNEKYLLSILRQLFLARSTPSSTNKSFHVFVNSKRPSAAYRHLLNPNMSNPENTKKECIRIR